MRLIVAFALCCALRVSAQIVENSQQESHANQMSPHEMERTVSDLKTEVEQLRQEVEQLRAVIAQSQPAGSARAVSPLVPASMIEQTSASATPSEEHQDRANGGTMRDFLRGTTLNLALDTYYGYNFNHPIGRVNLLRAYDVLSNNISLNQATVVLERAPDPSAGRRWGARVDLQFGQATDTLQGNPANESRPDIYRNIFQAYGTYIVPVGSGVNVDFGKWASSLGIEGNYAKDQLNYSRSFYFNFMPFYHTGIRANYKVNDKVALNYWVVNGANHTEDTNGFKDQLFGFVATPKKQLTWTANYYLGQEHFDVSQVSNCGSAPQPGLCLTPLRPAPDGRTHIFDTYVNWQASSKWTLALEGDYFIQRLWRDAAPGQSATPAHVIGGAAYARYQLTPKVALAGRGEYLSDRGGLFSGVTQALKEVTATFDYKLTDDFLMRYEWRRDFSNQRYFLTDTPGVLSHSQNTATVGLVWWWGEKKGSW